jgi:hypothetical protein
VFAPVAGGDQNEWQENKKNNRSFHEIRLKG